MPTREKKESHGIQTDPHDGTQEGPMLKALVGSVRQAVSHNASRSSVSIRKDRKGVTPNAGGSRMKFPAESGAKLPGATEVASEMHSTAQGDTESAMRPEVVETSSRSGSTHLGLESSAKSFVSNEKGVNVPSS